MKDLDTAPSPSRVLERNWGERESVTPVSIGVNRRVWRAGDTYLCSSWPDEREAVQKELRFNLDLADDPSFHFTVPAPLPTSEDQLLVADEGWLWWRTRAVGGRHPDPTDPAEVRAVAAALARLHEQLAASHVGGTVQQIRFGDWPDLALQFLQENPSLLPAADERTVRGAVELTRASHDVFDVALQLVHGDPSFPNIVCQDDGTAVRITGFLDWQEAAQDTVLTDLSVLGNTIWERSGSAEPRELLSVCLTEYASAGGLAVPIDDVFLAMLAAKLQSVAHHGARFVAGKGPRERLDEQPGNITRVLDEF